LISALYFKAGWDKTFDPAQTRDEPFTRADGQALRTPMMRRHDRFNYLENDRFQLVDLEYADPRFSLSIVLPKPSAALTGWSDLLSSTRGYVEGDVIIPRLELEWGEDLKPALSRMGLAQAFSPSADYAAAVSSPVRVDQIVHRTLLVVDEQGAEAVALTEETVAAAADVEAPSKPFIFRADRPFFVVITENSSGAPLFMAFVAEPRNETSA
jgi:serpin B